jgi:hypothetical protein
VKREDHPRAGERREARAFYFVALKVERAGAAIVVVGERRPVHAAGGWTPRKIARVQRDGCLAVQKGRLAALRKDRVAPE